MITQAVIDVFSRVAAFLVGLLPSWSAPSWLTTSSNVLTDAVHSIALYSGWLPLQAIGLAAGFLLGCSTIALGIRLTRIGISLFTGGGGSAA